MNHSTSIAMRGLTSPRVSLLQTEFALYETFGLDPCLGVPTFAVLKDRGFANDPHRTEVLERHYIQPTLSFWLLLLKCQQHHGYSFIATLQCACSFLSYIKDCNYDAVEPSSCKLRVNTSLILGSEIFLCGSFYKKCYNHSLCATIFF